MGYDAQLMESVEAVNAAQKRFLFARIERHFKGGLKGRSFAVWGLAFKPNTDDMREAPSLTLIDQLLNAGAEVRAFDPVAMPEAQRILGSRNGLSFAPDAQTATRGADALAIVTE